MRDGLTIAVERVESDDVRDLLRRVATLRLETGVRQPGAIRLCERAGFARCDPFGSDRDDPLSIFMEKPL